MEGAWNGGRMKWSTEWNGAWNGVSIEWKGTEWSDGTQLAWNTESLELQGTWWNGRGMHRSYRSGEGTIRNEIHNTHNIIDCIITGAPLINSYCLLHGHITAIDHNMPQFRRVH